MMLIRPVHISDDSFDVIRAQLKPSLNEFEKSES